MCTKELMHPIPSSHGLKDAVVTQRLPRLEARARDSVELNWQFVLGTIVMFTLGCGGGLLEFADEFLLELSDDP